MINFVNRTNQEKSIKQTKKQLFDKFVMKIKKKDHYYIKNNKRFINQNDKH